ncbi:MAG TPA: tetratricopeptide repeat protein [Phycisphaerales bacterium]|nr:tetratricopeptide repeat protein [Phycisphaerales bacterium]
MAMPMSKKEQLGEQARRRFAAGDFHAAARLYAELARAEPGNPSILFQLGKAESLSGDASGAIRHLAQALKAKPDDPAILAQLAICQRQAGVTNPAPRRGRRWWSGRRRPGGPG